ncbi:MAG: tRNA lysidine(34) synthetase TilS [Candidatus Aminicenantales bacterium]
MSKTRRGRVFQAFKAAVLKQAMIVPGDRVLAACSGGPDSVALVRLLLKLREEMPLEIVIAHFNHRIRAEAGADESFVAELAGRWVLPLVSGSKNVRREAAKRNLNLEETARILRYEFFRDAARKTGATKIATGHNMNDQAETFLMRLFRGAGLPGLSGIEAVSGPAACSVIRPLLGVRREEIEAYLRAERLEFRTDASNTDRRFLRNRIRLGLLPEIERNYEPRIVEHLARLAALIGEEDDLLSGFNRALADEFILRSKGEASLDVRTLALVPPALARRVAREFIREIKGDLRAVSFEDIESVLALKEGKGMTVKKGLALRREHGRLSRVRPASAARAFEKSWDGRGEFKAGGMTFRGKTVDCPAGFSPRGDDRRRVVLDQAKVVFPLVVRGRRPGDLYRPVGAPGRKKLKEILRAKGVARGDRDRLPVFLSGGEILWVQGLPAAEKFKVEAATKRLFSIEWVGSGRGTQRR